MVQGKHFVQSNPALAEGGAGLLYPFGVGLAFLSSRR
jgi:hypothetical protein